MINRFNIEPVLRIFLRMLPFPRSCFIIIYDERMQCIENLLHIECLFDT